MGEQRLQQQTEEYRPATVGHDVAVPFVFALAGGLILGLAALAFWRDLALAFQVAAGAMVIGFLGRSFVPANVVQRIEQHWGVDLDGDGQIGEPEPPIDYCERYEQIAAELMGRAIRSKNPLHDCSRDVCVGEGVCNQGEWNRVNEACRAAGLRSGHIWTPAKTVKASMDKWKAHKKLRAGRWWIISDDGTQRADVSTPPLSGVPGE